MKFLPTLASFVLAAAAVDVRTVYQFPNPTWLENIQPTRNGSLLVTVIGRAEVHIVHPQSKPTTSSLLASIPNANAVLGITELEPNFFAIGAGNVTPANAPVTGTFAIWSIDLRERTPNVTKIADVPNVDMVNGLEALNAHTLLIADSWAGNIVKLDIKTKAYNVALSHASLASNFSVPALPLGVNGVKVHGGYLYYSNTVQRLVGRVRIDSKGNARGPFKVLASGASISVPDDFAVADDGSVYVASPIAAPQGDTLQHISLDGKVATIAEGGAVAGATAARFGRTKKDRNVVYLSTMGGFGADGLPKEGGRVVAVTIDC
ncbi:hypothetical protein IQ07DRAFT_587558 [Pyrenochaeta sp. DS3sAY3a]|nr:hypothetical protein IQ07DRAFT_587558 [Pyrenochaeta sp. DS3sAY3a]